MEQLLQMLLQSSKITKKLHWTTKSFSEHVALEELYKSLDEMTDRLAEEWMGKYGNDLTLSLENLPWNLNETTAQEFVKSLFVSLNNYKEILPQDDWLSNTFEELQGKVSRVKFKLDNLK